MPLEKLNKVYYSENMTQKKTTKYTKYLFFISFLFLKVLFVLCVSSCWKFFGAKKKTWINVGPWQNENNEERNSERETRANTLKHEK